MKTRTYHFPVKSTWGVNVCYCFLTTRYLFNWVNVRKYSRKQKQIIKQTNTIHIQKLYKNKAPIRKHFTFEWVKSSLCNFLISNNIVMSLHKKRKLKDASKTLYKIHESIKMFPTCGYNNLPSPYLIFSKFHSIFFNPTSSIVCQNKQWKEIITLYYKVCQNSLNFRSFVNYRFDNNYEAMGKIKLVWTFLNPKTF